MALSQKNMEVLVNIIGAVESGGQIYGNRRYDAYAAPYTNTSNEHTITLGWAQNYGYEAKKLIQMIYNKNPEAFAKIDTNGVIKAMLSKDWVAIRWNPNSTQKALLIKLISSSIGKACQDELFAELMNKFVADCESTYSKNVGAIMMYCQIRHLGGRGPADRIFKRCGGNYSLDNIMNALKRDQNDTSSSNQVGDRKFWSRHQKCYEFIKKYADLGGITTEVKTVASPLSRAKTLLRQPQSGVMTGYTPTGKSYFVNAGKWYSTPQTGDVIYFYSSAKGRVGHTGIVERVDAVNKYVYTVEGNTSSTEYAENGGCVARHSYSYRSIGGTNRVNGFGRPNFAGAGVTAAQFVATAVSFLGYLEKASNAHLDDKKANRGSNNYQRFQRDVGAGNGDQWCQYFVDAMALYTCQGVDGGSSSSYNSSDTKLNETSKWTGYVTGAGSLNVRTWAGTENAAVSFSPLKDGTAVGVCDTVKASNGDNWYYILYNGKHGFVSAKYIGKAKSESKTNTADSSTKYGGLDYSAVYSYSYYKKHHADLQKAFGDDESKYFEHFINHGMKEGRQANKSFNVKKYKANYEDLRKAFGNNLPEYYKHYIQYGKKEGRKAT